MAVKEIKSSVLGEKYFEIDHKSGLKIYVMPKENYSSAYAIFGTKYGSVDTRFMRSDSKSFTEVPEGIAHFLEHKLFESEELGAFERYAKTGASANAYTSFDKTCYLFQCSDNFKQSLEILIDFVQNPYFTAETVQKEQGIIAQEIRMYLDSPGWMSTFNLLKCFYHKNPVRIDIAGTVDSIAQITDTLLYDCYNTFYNLHNMALAVVGNVTVDDVLEVCDKFLKDAPPLSIERSFDDEPRDIVCDYKEHNLPVSIPTFSFGYKEACEKAIPTFRENILTDVLMEIIAGQTSTLYSRLVEDGLVDTSFGGSYFIGNGFETVIFEGESQDPEAVSKAIKEEIASLKANGITEEQFEIARRSLYGQEIMSFNDTDTIANALIACDFNGWSLYDGLEIYQQITLQEVQERLNSMMDEKYSALSVVRNK